MKKLFLLFAAIAFSVSSFAQKADKASSRQKLAEGMSSFTTAVKPAYKAGQTYVQFEKAVVGAWKPSDQGRQVLKKAFGYLSSGTTSSRIISQDSGLEVGNLLSAYESVKTSKPTSTGVELFGGTTGGVNPFAETQKGAPCKWYQIGCIMQAVLDFVNQNAGTLCFILGFFNIQCHQTPTFQYEIP